MLGSSDDDASLQSFEAFDMMKDDLLRLHPGGFAVICGRRLVGTFGSVEDAMAATSRAFDAGALPPGASILISQIAAKVTIRVMATPHTRAAATAQPGA
jgi:hypothetical protein